MIKLFKKIFPLYFKLIDGLKNKTNTELTAEEHIDLVTNYILGKLYIVIAIYSIITWELLKYLYSK